MDSSIPFDMRAAYRGDPMPEGLNFAEQWLYQTMAALYARHRTRALSAERGQQEQRKIMAQYQDLLAQHKYLDIWVQHIKATEAASSAYRKNPCRETADDLLAASEGCRMGAKK